MCRVTRLFDRILDAVSNDQYVISWHADERCEERGVSAWQVVAGLSEARLLRERRTTRPNPTIVVRQPLADGTEVEVVWAWLAESERAKLVTVYFPDYD